MAWQSSCDSPTASLKPDRVRLVDWTNPAANDFFLASQIWFTSDLYTRRPDAIGFVNGIPLLLCELKAPTAAGRRKPTTTTCGLPRHDPAPVRPERLHILSNGLEALMGAVARALRGLRAVEAVGGGRRRRASTWRRCCGRPASRRGSST